MVLPPPGDPDAGATDATCGTGTGTLVTTVGAHTVTEGAGTGTDLNNYTAVTGTDCAADGTITLAAGDNKTCTITNTLVAFSVIVLVCRESDSSLYSSNVTVGGVPKNSLGSAPAGFTESGTTGLCTALLGGARYTSEAPGSHDANVTIPTTEATPTP